MKRTLESAVLAALGGLAAAVWLFIEIAGQVVGGTSRAWDTALLLALRSPSEPVWLRELARDITALGSFSVLALLTIAVAGYLVLIRRWHAAIVVAIAVVGGQLLSHALKLGFDRARPDIVPHGTLVSSASFPSGHAMMAAVTYLTLGALVARVHASLRIKAYVLLLALTFTVLVGVSRVYLGVHWPTDVAAGWVVGAAWALLCALVMRWLQRHGQVERPA